MRERKEKRREEKKSESEKRKRLVGYAKENRQSRRTIPHFERDVQLGGVISGEIM